MLRSALIDVGGTLWPDRWPPWIQRLYVRRLSEGLELSAVNAERLLVELETRDPALISPPPLEQDSSAMASAAIRAAGLTNISADHLLGLMDLPAHGVIDLLPGAKELLETLKSLGLRTVVFSNATFRSSAGYRRDFHSFSVSDLIHEVISSVDLGFRKPSDQMFAAALRAARCHPSECVVVGDSEQNDIVPAIARGMRAIRVAIEKPGPKETAALAVPTSMHEAAQILSSWRRHGPRLVLGSSIRATLMLQGQMSFVVERGDYPVVLGADS
jgi:HAD superfamily hydrolase (TIGR01509 family)